MKKEGLFKSSRKRRWKYFTEKELLTQTEACGVHCATYRECKISQTL